MWNRKRVAAPEEVPPITGTISGIVATARRAGRYELLIDGKQEAIVSIELIERLALRVGGVLDARSGAAVADAAGALATYDRALGLLAVQGRSARELRRKLVDRGDLPAHIDAAIERLAEAGLVDDAAYARQVARSRLGSRGDSRRRVAQVLSQKGVARDVADEAVAEVFADDAVDEEGMAESAARKKLRGLSALDLATQRRRLYGYLARRGYDGEVIRRVLGRVIGAAGAAGLEDVDDDEDGDDAETGALG